MRLFIIMFISMSFLFPNIVKAKEPFKPSELHQVLTSKSEDKDWLNTSRPLKSEDLAGRIVLVDFWTFCCINCIHVVQDLKYLEKKYGDKIAVIGIHSAKFDNEKDVQNIKNAILRYGIEHPVVNDDDFAIWKRFGVRSWPTLIIIAPDGRLNLALSGEGHRKELDEAIANLLKKYGDSVVQTPLPLEPETNKVMDAMLKFPGKIEYAANFQGSPAVFISDSGNNRILAARLDGKIFLSIGGTEEGDRDGSFSDARFKEPQGLSFHNGMLYIADTVNHKLKVADFGSKTIRTIAGTGERGYIYSPKQVEHGKKAQLASPWDIVPYTKNGKQFLAIANAGSHQLLSYNIDDETVNLLAGNGRESIDDGATPYNSLSQPSGLSVVGDLLYFVDSETSSLRVLNIKNGEINTLIGTGLFDFGYKEGKQGQALLQHPLGLFAEGNTVYIADSYNHGLRIYDASQKELINFAGVMQGGIGRSGTTVGELSQSRFNEPNDVLKIDNSLYVADTNNHRLLKIDLSADNKSKTEILNLSF
jgi:thiol-disulfide isomerase/thioredoxin